MSGGGGGSSGAVTYPAYMQTVHGRWLDNTGSDTPNNSLVDALNEAYDANPFTGVDAPDPDPDLLIAYNSVLALNTLVDALNHTADYTAAYDTARDLIAEDVSTLDTYTVDPARVAADVAAYS